ncbi:MAG TPA: hypothetical protein VK338_04110, partial [Candidatus Nitrosocosmicus sp.]|nr:hypothetical protein [Candidatus Nitrosocosmicus sp.]
YFIYNQVPGNIPGTCYISSCNYIPAIPVAGALFGIVVVGLGDILGVVVDVGDCAIANPIANIENTKAVTKAINPFFIICVHLLSLIKTYNTSVL